MPTIAATLLAITIATSQASTITTHTGPIVKCGNGKRITCVVDGDTLWLDGEKLRPMGFDTPEPRTKICGGQFEKQLAHKSTTRLMELLNTNEWTVERFGLDRYDRKLVTIRIAGEDIGDILIREGLARKWPDGHEWWCGRG